MMSHSSFDRSVQPTALLGVESLAYQSSASRGCLLLLQPAPADLFAERSPATLHAAADNRTSAAPVAEKWSGYRARHLAGVIFITMKVRTDFNFVSATCPRLPARQAHAAFCPRFRFRVVASDRINNQARLRCLLADRV
jgi:hypothetical protein